MLYFILFVRLLLFQQNYEVNTYPMKRIYIRYALIQQRIYKINTK